jgi:hypothetical protein
MRTKKNEEPISRPSNKETLLADKKLHEKSQERVTSTEHEECMDSREKERGSRDTIRLEVSEKSTKYVEGN